MSRPIIPLTVKIPGFFGLNTEGTGAVLPPGWASELENATFDVAGRINSRKGYKHVNGTVITNTPTVEAIHEFVDSAGNTVMICAADNKIYTEISGTMTDVSGTITTPTGNNWQFVNFNDWCVGFQSGHAPIVATDATAVAFANSGGTQYNGAMVCAAFGRLWTVSGGTLYYSDLLINNFTGGSSGSVNLSSYWPTGMDTAVAVVEHSGYLIVFGKRNILIYESADDVTNITLSESIGGIGCIARDSVQSIGDDLIFLSDTGVRSLLRTIADKAAPLQELSKHNRTELLSDVASETAVEIKSIYHEYDGFYLLSLPTTGVSWYFDLKVPNEDGTWKTSKWTLAPTAMAWNQANQMYVAASNGFVSLYQGYVDGQLAAGTGGSGYDFLYVGPWVDFSSVDPEIGTRLKILKDVNVLGSGTTGSTATFRWYVDYNDSFYTIPMAFSSVRPAKYGVAQYTIGTYSTRGSFERLRQNLSRSGQVVKFGFQCPINQYSFALQRLDVLAKLGKITL